MNRQDLVGIPDPIVLAMDMYSEGHMSCAEAELCGWFVTEHAATRAAVDHILAQCKELIEKTKRNDGPPRL